MSTAIVLMGVSGSGKTSIGRALSAELGWPFYDGDDFHSPENIKKMSQGIPLTDLDREPWLEVLHGLIEERFCKDENLILACSALKKKYRQQLRSGQENVFFVYLAGDFDLVWSRMLEREDHYMKPEMLSSQFDDLDYPSNALVIDIGQPVELIIEEIVDNMRGFDNQE